MTDHTTTSTGEYRYCGANVDRAFYTCNRRIGHAGPCGPDRDPDWDTPPERCDDHEWVLSIEYGEADSLHCAREGCTMTAAELFDGANDVTFGQIPVNVEIIANRIGRHDDEDWDVTVEVTARAGETGQ